MDNLQRSEEKYLYAEGIRGPALGPISITLGRGECVCLCGPSGAGKTRLLRAIADLDVHDGQVHLDGVSREQFSPPEWRRRVGLLPAESKWWFDRVADHFPPDIAHRFDALGLSRDLLIQPVSRLSSGERQRLALIRLVSNQPQVLLLDEPTANLDLGNVNLMEQFIHEYRLETGASILWVSHNETQIERVSDRRLLIQHGRIETSPPRDPDTSHAH